jgi:hypothetical protein
LSPIFIVLICADIVLICAGKLSQVNFFHFPSEKRIDGRNHKHRFSVPQKSHAHERKTMRVCVASGMKGNSLTERSSIQPRPDSGRRRNRAGKRKNDNGKIDGSRLRLEARIVLSSVRAAFARSDGITQKDGHQAMRLMPA